MTGTKSHFEITRLAAKYNQMQTDGRILSNRASLEIIRTRIQQLADRIDLNEAPDRLARLQQLWNEYKELEQNGQRNEARLILESIDVEFEKAYHDYAAWKQMFEALDLDRKMVESEVKIAKDIQAILTAEDAFELAAKLLGAIIATTHSMLEIPDHVKRLFLRRVQYEFTRITGSGNVTGLDGSGGEVVDAESDQVDREGVLYPGDETRSDPAGSDEVGTLPA
jgi:hypothetical protein